MAESDAPMDIDVDTDSPRVQTSNPRPTKRSLPDPNDLLASEAKFVKVDHNTINEYVMTKPLGYAVLTGNCQAPGKDVSVFAHRDINLMGKVLHGCGWDVVFPNSYKRSSEVTFNRNTFDRTVDSLRANDRLKDYSCFLFYYTGHGDLKDIVSGNNDHISYWDIIHDVSTLPALQESHKPKIFIFDTCRDSDSDPNVEVKDGSFNSHVLRDSSLQSADTIVCFSASIGGEAVALGCGSIYTMQLAHAIKWHAGKLSFSQIVTVAHGGTVHVSRALKSSQAVDYCHQPEFRSTLTRLLYLTYADQGVRDIKYSAVSSDSAHSGEVQGILIKHGDVEIKSPWTKGKPALCGGEGNGMAGGTVMTDRGGLPKKKEFRTKKEVTEHLAELGEGSGVFICYAPDPEGPYFDPKARTAEIDIAERYVFQLVIDLERHGFSVITDLHVRSTNDGPVNWLKWYSNRIAESDHVILVCSPAFNELFSREKPQAAIIDERADLLFHYSRSIYGQLERETDNRSKFIPVILDPRYTSNESVPTLFPLSSVYSLFKDKFPRQFDYDNRSGAFEKLVCRMAGIDRAIIDAPKETGVQQISADRGAPSMAIGHQQRYMRSLSKPRRGFKTIPSKYSQPQPSAQPHPAFPRGTVTQHHPQWGHPTYQAQPHGVQLSTQPQGVQQFAQPQGVQPFAQPQGVQPFAQPQGGPTLTQAHPLLEPLGQQFQMQPHSPAPGDQPDPSTLPDKPPRVTVFLWLSQRLTKWKFFARHLGLQEHDIDRIEIENRDDLREQCYKMFSAWHQQTGRACSYQTLGRVMLESEKNRNLYASFVEKVREAEET